GHPSAFVPGHAVQGLELFLFAGRRVAGGSGGGRVRGHGLKTGRGRAERRSPEERPSAESHRGYLSLRPSTSNLKSMPRYTLHLKFEQGGGDMGHTRWLTGEEMRAW